MEIDLRGNDLVWCNKPDLPAANEENRKLEETLRERKIEVERLKIILNDNINKGRHMRNHLSNLYQTLQYKQQMCKSKEHELEMEINAEKLMEREESRLEQEMKVLNQEIKLLHRRQNQKQAAITDQEEKRTQLKSSIQWDEDALLHYLEKSAQMERDNMALLKYSSEDDSKINELGLTIEKLSKELHERKNALDDADTEVFIVQSELDKIQEEFMNTYKERSKMIANWEKVINQIQDRSNEIQKLSQRVDNMKDEEKQLKQVEKEQLQLLGSEKTRNDELENNIKVMENFASNLHNKLKDASSQEDDLKAQLSTLKNVSSYLLHQKQVSENTLKQLHEQLKQKNERLENIKRATSKILNDIEVINKETFQADHYTKELEKILQEENKKNAAVQKEVSNLTNEVLIITRDIKNLKEKEKQIDSQIKNTQADLGNINSKINAVDRLRAKLEKEMYDIVSSLDKIKRRIEKMVGVTNEEEKRKIDEERFQLLSALDEKKKSLTMLTNELKIMMEKIAVSTKELEVSKKSNSELTEKIKSLEFYIANSQKSLKFCVTRKQELLVEECLLKFHVRRYQNLLRKKNESVFNLQKSKAEFETMMKERTEELKNCNDLVEAEIRSEEEEYSLVKRKLMESTDKIEKLKSKYKVIMDALGVSEPGESAESEMLIKAEEEKRDMMYERDQLLAVVIKNEEELSALKNTLWMINATNEQFRQVVYPPGISLEDSETLRRVEEEAQTLAIDLNVYKKDVKSSEKCIDDLKNKLTEQQSAYDRLKDVIAEKQRKNDSISKENADLEIKIQRAVRQNSQLSLNLRNQDNYAGLMEDIRIHLLREIRRTVSDLLFATVESYPEISSRVHQLYQEAQIPLPSRAKSSLSSSRSSSSIRSRVSKPIDTKLKSSEASSPLSSDRSNKSEPFAPSVITLGSSSFDDQEETEK